MSVSIAQYPDLRKTAMQFKSDIGTMIGLMDGIIASNRMTDALKEQKLSQVFDEYMP